MSAATMTTPLCCPPETMANHSINHPILLDDGMCVNLALCSFLYGKFAFIGDLNNGYE